jgi:DUF4097 and DUF4098 domain-containing protein YvlB
VVDGVRLDAKHEETLAVGDWHPTGLVVDVSLGDLVFEGTDGPSRIVGTVHEARLGDATLVYENGVLQARSLSGGTAALGRAHVYVHGELPALKAATGKGDIVVRGLAVAGAVALETGLGDVDARDVNAGGQATLSSGMGDVDVEGMHSTRITAESGLGDVTLRRVTTGDADVSSGLGDIALEASAFNILKAETGLGDVECHESTYAKGFLDTGLGSVDK